MFLHSPCAIGGLGHRCLARPGGLRVACSMLGENKTFFALYAILVEIQQCCWILSTQFSWRCYLE